MKSAREEPVILSRVKDLEAKSVIEVLSTRSFRAPFGQVQDDKRSNVTLFLLSYTPSQNAGFSDVTFFSIYPAHPQAAKIFFGE